MRFFLVDKVTELEPGSHICGIKCVSLTEQVLHDHFPDHPIMPGTLLVEGLAQLAGFLLERTWKEPKTRAVLLQLKNAKFRAVATPGDRLEMRVSLESQLGGSSRISGVIDCEGKRIADASLTFSKQTIESEKLHRQREDLYRLWTTDLH